MAFDISKFKLVGKSEGSAPNLYYYSSPDLKATIETEGYFNNVAPFSLAEGDLIIVTIDDDGTIDTMTLVVSDVTSGVVTTTESSSAEATSGGTEGQMAKFNASGLPADATNTDTEVSAAVTASHTRSHTLTSSDDHTSSATEGQMLKADANGLPVDGSNTDTEVAAAVTRAGKIYLPGEITDISTGGSYWTVSPADGAITKIYSVIDGVITGGDAALTFELGGTAITDAGITIGYDGSAAGDVDSSTPSALNTVTAGQAIEMITNGGSTNTVKAKIIFEITLS